VYLRETKRRNRDGSTVSYLQLAHSERHPVTGLGGRELPPSRDDAGAEHLDRRANEGVVHRASAHGIERKIAA
jgi:hypothetical protein